jgi:hypothetical protein
LRGFALPAREECTIAARGHTERGIDGAVTGLSLHGHYLRAEARALRRVLARARASVLTGIGSDWSCRAVYPTSMVPRSANAAANGLTSNYQITSVKVRA